MFPIIKNGLVASVNRREDTALRRPTIMCAI